ncbi:MAG TPA: zf-HC2 domain-containing protein [Acidobacteriota bacterium]|nr:zf-HC2 domain-containing protein [Acidobacteriota bacterium]
MVRQKTASTLTNKSCKEIADLILGHLNDQLPPRIKRDFERHLEICPDCVSFLNTYKKTIQATGTVNPVNMPPKVRDNLLTFLRKQIRRVGAVILYFGAHFLG